MRRLEIWILLGLFGIILFEMCRELANRSYVLFGLVPTNPDFVTYVGLAILGILILAIYVVSTRRPKSKGNAEPVVSEADI